MPERPFFVVNPKSAGGRTASVWWRDLHGSVLEMFPRARWALTKGPRQAAALAARAAVEGADLVVAVGGDGTVNEVVNGLMGERLGAEERLPAANGQTWSPPGERPDAPALGVVPVGTGCDFVKSIGVPNSPVKALELLRAGKQLPLDVCEMTLRRAAGNLVRRYSMNMCGCGASGEVTKQVNAARFPRHGLAKFFIATARAALAYRPREIQVEVDGLAPRTTRLLGLFVCNGEYCGGGMRPGKGARLDDGTLRVVEIADIPLSRILRHGYKLYTGRLEGIPGVSVYDASSLRVRGPSEILVDCDGEQPGTLPATYSVVRRALRVVGGNTEEG
ncbi:MAG: diacylglycerol kinase family protein [Vicinamibacterales bacterium]